MNFSCWPDGGLWKEMDGSQGSSTIFEFLYFVRKKIIEPGDKYPTASLSQLPPLTVFYARSHQEVRYLRPGIKVPALSTITSPPPPFYLTSKSSGEPT